MERAQISMDPVSSSINDIRIYAEGIEIALSRGEYREAAEYVNDIRMRLETVAGFIEESEGSEISR